MDKFIKRFTAFITAALVATVPAFAPVLGAEEETAKVVSLRMAAYYDADGNLVSVKRIGNDLSADETEVFVNLYDPTNAVKAKVFAWTAELEPVEDDVTYSLKDEENSVVILHTNDMHGSLADSSSIIGSDRVATLKKMEGAVLADGGDATQGVALASQSKGMDIISIMNAAGYDVMALGNHEFDYGQDQLKQFLEMADFPMISANTYLNGDLLCKNGDNNGENVIIERNGIKVGIFALTTKATETSTKPENLTGIEFRDEIETAKEQVEKLDSEGVDVIVALVHMGVLDDAATCTSRELAQAMKDTELDAIIDGHSHTEVNEVVEGTGITLAQTGTGGVNVGHMEISVADDGSVTVDETLLSRKFFENITPDPTVTAVIDELNGELSEALRQPIGTTANTLWGGSVNGKISESRSGETNLGDLICDAMIAEAEDIMPADKKALPIVAIENGGGFRTAIPNGSMNIGSVINCLPFANAVMTKEITPAVLYAALDSFVSSVTAQDKETGFLTASYSGSFPQIGGMSFVYDPNAKDAKVTSVTLKDGTVLNRDDTSTRLILVSNDYVIANKAFTGCPAVAEGSGLTESVLAYIAELTANGTKPLELPVTEGRINTVNNDENRKYTARIEIKGNNVPAELTAIIDGKDKVTGKVTDGILDLQLSDGPHAVKLYDSQQEIYVNNYSGNGTLEDYGTLHLGWPELEYSAE